MPLNTFFFFFFQSGEQRTTSSLDALIPFHSRRRTEPFPKSFPHPHCCAYLALKLSKSFRVKVHQQLRELQVDNPLGAARPSSPVERVKAPRPALGAGSRAAWPSRAASPGRSPEPAGFLSCGWKVQCSATGTSLHFREDPRA